MTSKKLFIADRVLVLDGGKIAIEERIDLPCARDVGPEFRAIRRRQFGHQGILKNSDGHMPIIVFRNGDTRHE